MPNENPGGQEPTAEEQAAARAAENGGGQEPETFDREYVAKIRNEAAAARTELRAEREKVKAFEDRDKSEMDKLTERLSESEKRAATAETELARTTIALTKGLPKELASRLRGSTVEEMEADADELLKFAQPATKPGSFNGGVRGEPAAGSFDDQIRAAIRR